MGRASGGGASITEWAPAASASRAKAIARSVDACETPTQTGIDEPAAPRTPSMTTVRSASPSRPASPSTPRIVIPSTPVARTNATSPGSDAGSSEPSAVNGVGTMFQTPRSAPMSPMPSPSLERGTRLQDTDEC